MSLHQQIIQQFIDQKPAVTPAQQTALLAHIQPFFGSVTHLGNLADTLADWCMDNNIDLDLSEATRAAGNPPAKPVTPEEYKRLVEGIINVINPHQTVAQTSTNQEGKAK
ncbi:hypothetical protein [Thioflexithrix psekupsensis]|uniref:Uncharacterized protein n=1 Tax=Thioflexithrix psekupsensis TaxID=1570016 RepID=A0A251X8F5_9GAMM|nr:hypothetical protein [Thioflexithrix psekupsensis]OUD14205.1 hypothetical protein TPSD3_07695 [Thioflexithrix psekupsensis]